MRRAMICLICLGFSVLPATGGLGKESDENGFPLACGAQAGFYSKYIWRGMEVNDKGVFQPEAQVSLYGFEAGIWGNLELTDSLDNRGKFTEVDYILSYNHDSDFLSVGLVYFYYDYPHTDEKETQEIGLVLEAGEEVAAALEIYYDFDQAQGVYCKPSLGYRLDAGDLLLTPSIGLGWASEKYNDYYFGAGKNSLVDAEILLTAEADIYRGIYLTLTVGYYRLLGSDLRREVEDGKDGFWGGGGLGFAF
jgi:hypothetical protein